ncbi:hypothetical protein PRIPAC_79480, partial [Pristionchus pacificus]
VNSSTGISRRQTTPFARQLEKSLSGCVHHSTLHTPIIKVEMDYWMEEGIRSSLEDRTRFHDEDNEVIEERMESLAVGDDDSNKKAFLDMLIAEKDRANLSMLDIREEV